MGHHKEHQPAGQEDFKVGKDNAAHETPAGAQDTTTSAKESEEVLGLRAQQERLMKRLSELRDASTDAWGELKTGAENAFEELRGSVQKVITRFESALGHQDHEAK